MHPNAFDNMINALFLLVILFSSATQRLSAADTVSVPIRRFDLGHILSSLTICP
jgi:hypothetical protein